MRSGGGVAKVAWDNPGPYNRGPLVKIDTLLVVLDYSLPTSPPVRYGYHAGKKNDKERDIYEYIYIYSSLRTHTEYDNPIYHRPSFSCSLPP